MKEKKTKKQNEKNDTQQFSIWLICGASEQRDTRTHTHTEKDDDMVIVR